MLEGTKVVQSSIHCSGTFHKSDFHPATIVLMLVVLRIFIPVILISNTRPLTLRLHQFLKHHNSKVKNINIKTLMFVVNIVVHVIVRRLLSQLWELLSNDMHCHENCEGFHNNQRNTKPPCPLTTDNGGYGRRLS